MQNPIRWLLAAPFVFVACMIVIELVRPGEGGLPPAVHLAAVFVAVVLVDTVAHALGLMPRNVHYLAWPFLIWGVSELLGYYVPWPASVAKAWRAALSTAVPFLVLAPFIWRDIKRWWSMG